MHPFLRRLLRMAVIGSGAIMLTSAIVNIIDAMQLIEPSDEAALGVTKLEVVSWFIVPLLSGVALITLGLWPWRKRPAGEGPGRPLP